MSMLCAQPVFGRPLLLRPDVASACLAGACCQASAAMGLRLYPALQGAHNTELCGAEHELGYPEAFGLETG